MTAIVIRADARTLPLPDASVDLVVTSPPYWKLRRYGDGGKDYAGQIGCEPTPGEYLENLWAATAEMVRVVKPCGSIWVNVGDRYSTGNSGESRLAELGETYRGGGHGDAKAKRKSRPAPGFPPKTLIGLPWRYALGCADRLGLILRRDVVWHKANPVPESVVDRCPSRHEYLFMFTVRPRYYSAADEIREPHADTSAHALSRRTRTDRRLDLTDNGGTTAANPLGRIPGSVWMIPSEPLAVPEVSPLDGRPLPAHYAAFPTALPRRIILGWSPHGICTACGEGRRPVSRRQTPGDFGPREPGPNRQRVGVGPPGNGMDVQPTFLVDYACACPEPAAPTRPAVVLDSFGGSGTTALTASALGRTGITADPVHGYGRIARWRTTDPRQRARAAGKPARAKPAEPPPFPGQQCLFDGVAG